MVVLSVRGSVPPEGICPSNVIEVIAEQPLKAPSPILDTPLGIITLFNDTHPSNADTPILTRLLGIENSTDARLMHPLNALSDIAVTLPGIVISTIFVKANEP
jgi:hypothetical protein